MSEHNPFGVTRGPAWKGKNRYVFFRVYCDVRNARTVILEEDWKRLTSVDVTDDEHILSSQILHGFFCSMNQLGYGKYPFGISQF